MFEYHGAEHKVVFNFESGKPVNVENAQTFTHVPSALRHQLPVGGDGDLDGDLRVPAGRELRRQIRGRASLLIPVIAGLSYELIRFAAKRQGALHGAADAPGLWLQRITTKPPSDDQTEVAIRALDGAMALEQKQGGELVIA